MTLNTQSHTLNFSFVTTESCKFPLIAFSSCTDTKFFYRNGWEFELLAFHNAYVVNRQHFLRLTLGVGKEQERIGKWNAMNGREFNRFSSRKTGSHIRMSFDKMAWSDIKPSWHISLLALPLIPCTGFHPRVWLMSLQHLNCRKSIYSSYASGFVSQ